MERDTTVPSTSGGAPHWAGWLSGGDTTLLSVFGEAVLGGEAAYWPRRHRVGTPVPRGVAHVVVVTHSFSSHQLYDLVDELAGRAGRYSVFLLADGLCASANYNSLAEVAERLTPPGGLATLCEHVLCVGGNERAMALRVYGYGLYIDAEPRCSKKAAPVSWPRVLNSRAPEAGVHGQAVDARGQVYRHSRRADAVGASVSPTWAAMVLRALRRQPYDLVSAWRPAQVSSFLLSPP